MLPAGGRRRGGARASTQTPVPMPVPVIACTPVPMRVLCRTRGWGLDFSSGRIQRVAGGAGSPSIDFTRLQDFNFYRLRFCAQPCVKAGGVSW